ncbi:MAG: indole-3-glycerol phosphate synthase TrpC, partial [Anaerolineales bacterium]|nr:indole-3-glycerol phosphate synthase TrpC [Anaerolineales bacterium]
ALPIEQLEERAQNTHFPPDFAAALTNPGKPTPRLIAEIKQRSPSKGMLREPFDALPLAETYAHNGAAAISVLTDEKYFGGCLGRLRMIHALGLGLPLLRKDFIFDRYQLLEARAAGASAALLIVAMLKQAELAQLIAECNDLGLTPLVEVHDEAEFKRALDAGACVIGINNRNLHDFSVSLETSLRLVAQCPEGILLVSESGIKSQADIECLGAAGVDAILVGESLVTAEDVAEKVRSFTRVAVR